MRVALTDRFVAGVRAGTRAEFFDAKTKGLSLRVAPTGTKTWAFHFTATDGKRARLTLGTYPATSLAAARAQAIEAHSLIEAGADPRQHKVAGMTLAMLAESYLAKHVRNLRSAKEVERRLRKNVLPHIGAVRLADLHRRDVNRVLDQVLERGRPIEANLVFADIRAMLRWANSRGDLDRDPVQGMKAPSTPRSRERVLNDDEIRWFWEALPTAFPQSIDAQRILKLCLITAQRVGEVAGMDRRELDLDRRLWSLPGSRTKNGFPHSVSLSEFAVSLIEEAIADSSSSRVFALPPAAVARLVKRAQAKFGIVPAWTPHDLRRTALTGMARLGVTPIVLGHVANHRTMTKAGMTLSVYVHHAYDREKREALELWADRLRSIVAGTPLAEVVPLRVR